jgi:oligoendopeptidase F
VLLNWTNSYDDISTLAHELGHAVHGTLVKKQKRYNADYPLCFAETASIMNETILLNSFLKDNPEHKEQYLLSYLEDMFGTIFRQIMYISFEYRAHKRYLDGEVLNHDDYSKMWEEETKEMYGDAVHYGDYEFNGWSMIPHIFDSPFYCYSYAFGNILSIALYNMYSTSADKTVFVDKYKEFLSAGESDTPENLLKIFELSYKEDFMYDNAFNYISDLLASLE